jgi:hypothetical protein
MIKANSLRRLREDYYMPRHGSRRIALMGFLGLAASAFAWGEGTYCYPFSVTDCKKGDIIVGVMWDIVKYCDFEKNMVTLSTTGSGYRVACVYVGEKRKNRHDAK